MAKTFYKCNGKLCKDGLYCKVKHKKNWLCAHTTFPQFAVNEPCPDPWNHPERFRREVDGRRVYYVEIL